MVGIACLCALFMAHRYLDELEQREVLTVDQANVARFDGKHQERYRYFRDHEVSAEKAFRQVWVEWEREQSSQTVLHESPQTAHYIHHASSF